MRETMNLFDLNNDTITMNIDGKDIEMKPAICFDKEYEKWLVSKCGLVWSLYYNKLLKGVVAKEWRKKNKKVITHVKLLMSTPKDYWKDGSGLTGNRHHTTTRRNIKLHKMVIDTWKPLYDNPPEGIEWEEWEIARDLPSIFNHVSKTVVIDHIDDDPTNNHLDNLRRVTSWDNNSARKARGI